MRGDERTSGSGRAFERGERRPARISPYPGPRGSRSDRRKSGDPRSAERGQMTKGVGRGSSGRPFGVACYETLRRRETGREVRRFETPLGTNQRRPKVRRRSCRGLRVERGGTGHANVPKGRLTLQNPPHLPRDSVRKPGPVVDRAGTGEMGKDALGPLRSSTSRGSNEMT